MDIIKFVSDHRLAYREFYMTHTRLAKESEELVIPVFFTGDKDTPDEKYRNSEILFKFRRQPPSHWATNVIQKNKDNSGYSGIVNIDPELCQMSPEMRKAVLAEEWLEIMLGIEHPSQREQNKTANKLALIELYCRLGRNAPWMDDSDERFTKHIGLQQLLVSGDTVRRFLKERYMTTIEQLREQANQASITELQKTIRSVELSLAAERFLPVELVQLRLQQEIFSE